MMQQEGEDLSWGDERPKKVADCIGRPLPCPWVGCRYHTLIDVSPGRGIMINHGMQLVPSTANRQRPVQSSRRLPIWKENISRKQDDRRSNEIVEVLENAEGTCLLSMVHGERRYTLEDVGRTMNITRERVRQIEVMAMEKAMESIHELGFEHLDDLLL